VLSSVGGTTNQAKLGCIFLLFWCYYSLYNRPLCTDLPIICQPTNIFLKLQMKENFYGAQYDHVLLSEKDSYVNIGRLRFFYTTKTLISSMR
jgi:hypothetical protein